LDFVVLDKLRISFKVLYWLWKLKNSALWNAVFKAIDMIYVTIKTEECEDIIRMIRIRIISGYRFPSFSYNNTPAVAWNILMNIHGGEFGSGLAGWCGTLFRLDQTVNDVISLKFCHISVRVPLIVCSCYFLVDTSRDSNCVQMCTS
jgi:hypothetical protein